MMLFWILRRDYLVSLPLTADTKLHISFVRWKQEVVPRNRQAIISSFQNDGY